MSLHRNRVQMGLSAGAGNPGTGTLTLGTATAGYQSFGTAYSSANATVDILITEGTNWEVARNCLYTHSGTTVGRGTFEASSSGSAVSFTSAAIVSVIATADFGNRAENTFQSLIPGGRLTTQSNVPVSTEDRTSQSTLYYTPCAHNVITLWDGTQWAPTVFSETSLALSGLTSGREYDVFAYLNSGSLALELLLWPQTTVTFTAATDVVNWTSTPALNGDMVVFSGGTMPTGLTAGVTYYVRDAAANSFKLAANPGGAAIDFTTDGSGSITAKVQQVTLQDGRYCKNGDKTRLLLGAIYTTSTSATEDSKKARYVDNIYNTVARSATCIDTTAHTYTTATAREWNNASGLGLSRFQFIDCIGNKTVSIDGNAQLTASSVTTVGYASIAINNVSPLTPYLMIGDTDNLRGGVGASVQTFIGLNFCCGTELGAASVTFQSLRLYGSIPC